MSEVLDSPPGRFVPVGASSDLARLIAEYGIEASCSVGLIRARMPVGFGGAPRPAEYLMHESLLRSHDEFPCAGDGQALLFCRQIAAEMVTELGIPPAEAVPCINRHWSVARRIGRGYGLSAEIWCTTRHPHSGHMRSIKSPTRTGR